MVTHKVQDPTDRLDQKLARTGSYPGFKILRVKDPGTKSR